MDLAGELCQAEIHDFRNAVFCDDHIRRLNVAVDDADLMGFLETLGDLEGKVQASIDWQLPFGNFLSQRTSFVVIHDDEQASIGSFFDIMNRTNVVVLQRGSRLCFVDEAFFGLAVTGEFGWKKLEGNGALKPSVFCFINDTHTAAAKVFKNSVVGDDLANH